MKIEKTPEGIWQEYEKGKNYNTNIGLYETVKQNENFFIGKQWEGVIAPDLEKPVLNFLKRVITYFISMIVSDDVAASITPLHKGGGSEEMAKALSEEIDRVIERTNVKSLHRDLLRNTAVDGDGCFYWYFDPGIETGQAAKGEICVENVDNTKVLFGNPYCEDVQKQPYLIVVRRLKLETVRDMAEKAKLDPSAVMPDEGSYYGEDKDSGTNLVTVLLKLWKENGTVFFTETTKEVTLKNAKSTQLKLYPISYLSWDKIKNSYHGQAAITGLIPNQIFVNKLWAMAMEHQKKMAFPKLFYDVGKFPNGINNKAGQAVGVNGDPNQAVLSSFRAGDMSDQALDLVEKTISYSRDFMGASDAALGNVRPDNTSAIIAVQKASSAPLELQRLAFYQFIEDYVRIILDMMRVYYGQRTVNVEDENGNTIEAELNFSMVNYDGMQLKVDVGSAAYWSELMQIQTLDNLFSMGVITDVVTYLEGIPEQYLKNKNKIIAKLKAQQEAESRMGGDQGALPQMPDGSADSGYAQGQQF